MWFVPANLKLSANGMQWNCGKSVEKRTCYPDIAPDSSPFGAINAHR